MRPMRPQAATETRQQMSRLPAGWLHTLALKGNRTALARVSNALREFCNASGTYHVAVNPLARAVRPGRRLLPGHMTRPLPGRTVPSASSRVPRSRRTFADDLRADPRRYLERRRR